MKKPTPAHAQEQGLHLSRRSLLGAASAASLVALLGANAGPGSAPAAATTSTWATRARFDAYDLAVNGGNGFKTSNNEAGALSWNEAGILQAYFLMYKATADTVYIDKLIDHFDAVLLRRDSVRGVVDYRGLSLPAWRTSGSYVCSRVALQDSAGVAVLRITSALTDAAPASVAVSAGSAPGRFTISVSHPSYPTRGPDVYTDLSMDPTDARYAPTYINGEFSVRNSPSSRMLVTAKALAPSTLTAPVLGTFPCVPTPMIFSVDTGQILNGPVQAVREILGDPALSAYHSTALGYLAAIEDAVAVHDLEWRTRPATGGDEGYYIAPKGSSFGTDGQELPHNQSMSIGRCLIDLYAITGKTTYLDKVQAIARTFRNDLTLSATDGAYTWPYNISTGVAFSGWSPADDVSENRPAYAGFNRAEDISHGVIEIDFAARFVADGLDPSVLSATDVGRLAKTYTERLRIPGDPTTATAPSVRRFVDASGGSAPTYVLAATGWLPLGDSVIFDHCIEIFDDRNPAASASTIRGIAELNRF